MKLLMLCTGNTCRSPMAGVLASHLFQEEKIPVEIRTAGLSAFPGMAPSSQAVEVMEEKGLNMDEHQAESVAEEMIQWADLILTMTWGHKKRLLQQYPEARDKVFTLREYGQPLSETERALELNNIIMEKEQELLAAHKEELDELLRRQQELRRELSLVEQELEDWQSKFAEEIAKEQKELSALEQKIATLDIADPFGGPVDSYRQAAREIEDSLAGVIQRIMAENNEAQRD